MENTRLLFSRNLFLFLGRIISFISSFPRKIEKCLITKLNEISTYTLEIAILLSIVFLKLGVEKKTAQHIVFADGAALQQENIAVTRELVIIHSST